MTGFKFDARAALESAQKRQTLPNRPNRPNRGASGGSGLGGLGTVPASDPEMTSEELARDIFAERAAIREHDGGQNRADAEAAALREAAIATGVPAEEIATRPASTSLRRSCRPGRKSLAAPRHCDHVAKARNGPGVSITSATVCNFGNAASCALLPLNQTNKNETMGRQTSARKTKWPGRGWDVGRKGGRE